MAAYGLTAAALVPLSGGVQNSVWRVDTSGGAFALKRHESREPAHILNTIEVQQAAHASGVPTPQLVPNALGDTITLADGRAFVLSRFVPGRLYEPGAIPARAARRMGEVLGGLHGALETLSAGETPSLPSLEDIEALLRSLLTEAQARRGDPVDEIAEGVLEAKLDLLASIEAVPPLTLQWTHGDYEWRNVLFDDSDDVAAVIDFDEAAYYHPARDVMRCIALSFPNLEAEAYEFFAGYASVVRLGPDRAREYVEFYRYISTFRVWPIRNRYQAPERYQSRWDDLIQPFIAWDWDALSGRLAGIADELDRYS